jgi:hypothetical protein
MKKGYLFLAGLALAAFVFSLTTGFSACSDNRPQQGGTPRHGHDRMYRMPLFRRSVKAGTKDKNAGMKP